MKHANRIDMRFKYTPAAATDISKTIAKEKKRLADEKAKIEAEQVQKVRRISK